MKNTWILRDGAKRIECTTFPIAFRSLWGIRNRGLNPNKEKGEVSRPITEMTKSLSIIAPTGRVYSFFAACELARMEDLLKPDGEINSREFKKPRNNS